MNKVWARASRACGMILVAAIAGCTSAYTVPGGPAALVSSKTAGQAGGEPIYRHMEAKPVAKFPAMVCVARVQASGYQSRTAGSYGQGTYSVITTRDVESDEAMTRVGKLPGIAGLAPMNRLLLPPNLNTEADLRDAAARVKADILVMYTFDTQFYDRNYAAPLSVVTLGLSPNKRAFVTTTATALITDARTGYVYGCIETTDRSDQLANSWTTEDAIDDSRRRTEGRAFDKLVSELEKTWPAIVSQYGTPAPAAPTAATMPTGSR